jgi:hypothetical protein
MVSDYRGLKITDNLVSFGKYVLEEEITILAPCLRDMILKANKTTDNGKKDEDKSGPIRQG